MHAVSTSTSNTANDATGASHRRLSEHSLAFNSRNAYDDGDTSSLPVSPTTDSTRPDSPLSPDAAFVVSPGTSFAGNADVSNTRNRADGAEEATGSAAAAEEDDEEEFPLVLKFLLHSLRVLAAVPGCIGTFWLARNAWLLASQHGHLLSPGNMLVAANGTSRSWSSILSERPSHLDAYRFGRRQPGSLEFAVACLWSMSTAYHALSFTTLLLRRWLLYYSILPSLIRLVALQAICWPLVRITIHVFGADQPLGAWVVIGTTTALSDVVSRWVTSNIADAPLDDELDEEEEEQQDAENEALGYLSDSRFVKSPIRPNAAERLLHADQHPWSAAGGQSLVGDSDWDPRSGDESDAAAASFFASERERQRRQRRGGQGTRFWRAVIGGPSFAASSRRRKTSNRSSSAAAAAETGASRGEQSRALGAATETEMEGESDWPGYTTDGTVLGGGRRGDTPPWRAGGAWNQEQGLRRRLGAVPAHVSSPASATSPSKVGVFGRRPVLLPSKASSYRQGHTRFVYKHGAWTRERTSSRRNFHWEVAVWRNVVPIAVLSYFSMWTLIIDAMRLGD
ncbi:hypothetical protein EX895_003237 [Sporisorium graminicola]|uniref:Myp1 protein n=1 Tax=Sporisorium graminicola TaxID=280036 RepID=A0A4U7KU56_9BASI|nr:hypothetical protein EX895_003237 [Sporisorium graminicola]TKY87656.1 hypothetical protein EX895_003237 [Sporisorium graminicola]